MKAAGAASEDLSSFRDDHTGTLTLPAGACLAGPGVIATPLSPQSARAMRAQQAQSEGRGGAAPSESLYAFAGEEWRSECSGSQGLFSAVKRGDLEEVKTLFLRAKHDGFEFPLDVVLNRAAAHGQSEVVELMLKKRADVNRVDDESYLSPLMAAVNVKTYSDGHKHAVALLLKSRADTGPTRVYGSGGAGPSPMMLAAACGQSRAVEQLLDAEGGECANAVLNNVGASLTQAMLSLLLPSPLYSVGDTGHAEGALSIVTMLKDRQYQAGEDNCCNTALLYALAYQGPCSQNIIYGICKAWETATTLSEWNALHALCYAKDTSTLEFLLSKSYMQSALRNYERSKHYNLSATTLPFRFSPLHTWAIEGDVKAVRMLLHANADPSQVSHDNVSALGYAAEAGHMGVVRLLAENASEALLSGALVRAAGGVQARAVEFLLEARADARAVVKCPEKPFAGTTALIAAVQGLRYRLGDDVARHGVVRLLLEHKADVDFWSRGKGSRTPKTAESFNFCGRNNITQERSAEFNSCGSSIWIDEASKLAFCGQKRGSYCTKDSQCGDCARYQRRNLDGVSMPLTPVCVFGGSRVQKRYCCGRRNSGGYEVRSLKEEVQEARGVPRKAKKRTSRDSPHSAKPVFLYCGMVAAAIHDSLLDSTQPSNVYYYICDVCEKAEAADYAGYFGLPDHLSALMIAACLGHNKTVAFLLDRGADVNLCNDQQENALSLALFSKSDNRELVLKVLLEAGAVIITPTQGGLLRTALGDSHAAKQPFKLASDVAMQELLAEEELAEKKGRSKKKKAKKTKKGKSKDKQLAKEQQKPQQTESKQGSDYNGGGSDESEGVREGQIKAVFTAFTATAASTASTVTAASTASTATTTTTATTAFTASIATTATAASTATAATAATAASTASTAAAAAAAAATVSALDARLQSAMDEGSELVLADVVDAVKLRCEGEGLSVRRLRLFKQAKRRLKELQPPPPQQAEKEQEGEEQKTLKRSVKKGDKNSNKAPASLAQAAEAPPAPVPPGVPLARATSSSPQSQSQPQLQPQSAKTSQSIGGLVWYTDKVLGKGSNGTKVYRGEHEEWGQLAVKVVDKALVPVHRAKREQRLLLELAEKTGVGSDHVTQYRCIKETERHIVLGMELCGCSLFDLLGGAYSSDEPSYLRPQPRQPPRPSLPRAEQRRIVTELCRGVAFLHANNIVHRDLRPKVVQYSIMQCNLRNKLRRLLQNILFKTADETGAVKVADFGLSEEIDTRDADASFSTTTVQAGTEIGSYGYYAPEVYRREKPTPKVDVFSLGCCIFYALAGGRRPHEDPVDSENKFLLNANILSGNSNLRPIAHDPEAYHLVDWLICPERLQRPSVGEVLNYHPFFWQDSKRFEFLCEVGNQEDVSRGAETATAALPPSLLQRLVLPRSANGQWDALLDGAVRDVYMAERGYDTASLTHLLRFLRNANQHKPDAGTPASNAFAAAQGIAHYFLRAFPRLLTAVWTALVVAGWHRRRVLAPYLSSETAVRYLASQLRTGGNYEPALGHGHGHGHGPEAINPQSAGAGAGAGADAGAGAGAAATAGSAEESQAVAWSEQEVTKWLRRIGPAFGAYGDAFVHNGITGEELLDEDFGVETLDLCGVKNAVHQRRLFKEIKKLKSKSPSTDR